MRLLLRTDETQGHTTRPGTPGAANAVQVVVGRARQVVVHHGGQLRDVQPTRRQIGGHQHIPLLLFELGQYLRTRPLRHAGVKRRGVQAGLVQLGGHPVGSELGRDEDQHTLPLLLGDQVPQQRGPLRRIDLDGPLQDDRLGARCSIRLHLHRRAQQGLRQRLHVRSQGCGEKQVLPLRWQQRQHPRQLVGETELQQAVGFVEHQQLHRLQGQRVVCHQIEQAPWRGHHDVGTAAQAHHLRVDRHPAKQYRHLETLRH